VLGTHLVYDPSGNRLHIDALHQAMDTGVAGTYTIRLVWQATDGALYVTAHQGYPSRFIENRDFAIHLEGLLYHVDEDSLDVELTRLAEIVFAESGQLSENLRRWLLRADGDFIIVIRNRKTGEIAVVNDILARLPTYYSVASDCLVLSRNLWLAARTAGRTDLDRMAIGQYLLLGFIPGARTWFPDVHQLQPASLLMVRPWKASWEVRQVHELNLEGEDHAGRNGKENARELAGRFREACRNRSRRCGRPIVSLSGGLDSRAVAAGLWREEIPFAAVTFLDHRENNRLDYGIGRDIAASLGVAWHGFLLPATRGHDLARLLNLKHGLNSLRMSFLLPFFRSLIDRFGTDILYLTGDGGGDALGDSAPYRPTPTLDSLVGYLMERYQVFSVNDVAALTGVAPDELKTEITHLVDSYPERSPAKKYKHFFCLEVALGMYHHGEDRNRHYFWSATPFYANEFFTYAMNCPDSNKKGCRLYRDFLSELHPDLCEVRYANWNASILSTNFKLLYGIKNLTRAWPGAIRGLRRITGRYDTLQPDSNVLGCLKDQTKKCPDLGDLLDLKVLRRLLQNSKACDRIQSWTLFTLTSVIDDWTNPRPVLANYLDSEFE
jgi:asparagine synthase (glutamine-hydrolysing)